MPHMQHAGTIFDVGVCVRTATTNQMVYSTRHEAEVLGTLVNFRKYSYSYNLSRWRSFKLEIGFEWGTSRISIRTYIILNLYQ